MPTPVYSINVRGRDIGGTHRCATKEEAQELYDKLTAAVNDDKEFFEIELCNQKLTARKSHVSGFTLGVTMEETPEERKQRAIQRIESGGEYDNYLNAIGCSTAGGGLIGGF